MTSPRASSVSAGFRFPREVIAVAVRWYLRYGLSCRDVQELLAERGAVTSTKQEARSGNYTRRDFADALAAALSSPW